MKSHILGIFCVVSAAGCGNGNRTGGNDPPATPLAAGIKITQVALYQGLKTTLMKDGSAGVTREVPVVQGRDAVMRVFVEPDADFAERELKVRLELSSGSPIEVTITPTAASTEGNMASTANLDIPGDRIDGDTGWSVSLREAGNTKVAGSTEGAIFPGEGKHPFEAGDTGESLKVVLVPIKYNADGSGRLPDTGEAQVEKLRAFMFTLYPVRKVDITVGTEFPWSRAVGPDGSGWDQLLNAIVTYRQREGAPQNVYYYGLFAPASSLGAFCGGGCVAGLSPLAQSPTDDYARASIGLGYAGKVQSIEAAGTFVHEVGHAHGRQHAPCGLFGQPSDRNYPHTDAEIGDWGFDLGLKKLVDPAGDSRDMMSYCTPNWISDYTYKALFDRIGIVNGLAAAYQVPPPNAHVRWKSVVVDGAGRVTSEGEPVTLKSPPRGELRTMDHMSGHYYPFDHLPGGILLVPQD
jgi:hypothetical protein